MDDIIVTDANGNTLTAGDTVISTQNLMAGKMKIQKGTKVKNIRLTDDPEVIEGKIDGSMMVLKTCFFKRSVKQFLLFCSLLFSLFLIMSFLSQLNWRYATKKFDTTKKVSDEDLEKITEAIRLAPSSFGMQPYHFLVVTNPEKLAAIQAAAWNQQQITTASQLIVMCARNDFETLRKEYFAELFSKSPESEHDRIRTYQTLIEEKRLSHFTLEWAKKQVYIAHGFALAACAELVIDSCPMEGFDAATVKKILELPENLDVSVLLPIGYRASDKNPRPKFRFAKEKLFTTIS